MDCKFCNVCPATHYRVPTDFGVAELCDECAEKYGRRRRRNGRSSTTNATGSPATAARCDDLFPDPQPTQDQGICNDRIYSTES